MTVIEMPEFRRQATALLSDEEALELVTLIAKQPKAGEVVKNTGGVRKLRFAIGARGKRGGGRVIYVYYHEQMPVFLLACFPKNMKTDLTESEKKELRKLVPALKVAYEAGLEARIKTLKKTSRLEGYKDELDEQEEGSAEA